MALTTVLGMIPLLQDVFFASIDRFRWGRAGCPVTA